MNFVTVHGGFKGFLLEFYKVSGGDRCPRPTKKRQTIYERAGVFCGAGTPIPAAIQYKIQINRSWRAFFQSS
jgi:hypothetical protein